MLQVVIRESIFDIKSMFKGAKILFLPLIILFIIVINLMRVEGDTFYVIYFFIYSHYFIRPKISKIHFLLPMDNEYRKMYMYFKSSAFIVLFFLYFLISHSIAVLFGGYELSLAMKMIFCEDIPFFMVHSIYILNNGIEKHGANILFTKKDKKTGKNKSIYVLGVIAMSLPLLHEAGFSKWLPDSWYFLATIVSYICGLYSICLSYKLFKESDVNFEKLRNPRKLWTV
ncbi:MAG: hypothetical protein K0S18_1620 [Anaerocolumna sp.]|nr:hypothetical protein [Anaerocolumna sp.]